MVRPIRSIPGTRACRIAALATLGALGACASTPGQPSMTIGEQVTLQGQVVSVDTAPWAYDGNAVVTIDTTSAGQLRVQLPARWNLCKAQPLDDVQALKTGDRVDVTGTVTAADELVVCRQAEDHLRKLE